MKEVGGTPTVTPMGADATSEATSRFQVLIAGGGVAAVEALLALRALAPDRVRPTLVAPDPTFRYRPLSVTQPFGLGVPRGFDLAEMALANGGSFIHEAISGVVPERRRVRTAGGGSIAYDALLIAIGAQAGTTIPGALAFWDSADRGAYGEIVAELEAGRLRRLAFAGAGPGRLAAGPLRAGAPDRCPGGRARSGGRRAHARHLGAASARDLRGACR